MSRKLLLSLSLLSAGLLSAAPITVHNTGVNASDVVQPIGSTTSFWTLSSMPSGASETLGSNPFRYFNGSYYVDNSLSGWVSPGSNGNAGVGGIYTYQLSVNLTGLDPATAVISGLFGTDNDGAILLNGVIKATTGFADFGAPTAFTMNSGFVPGMNTISVQMNNGGDPTAFRVQFSSATANQIGAAPVPEPSTFLLITGGLAAVMLFRKRIYPLS